MAGPARNEPCPCGSGRKHKQCCGRRATERQALLGRLGPWLILAAIVLVVGYVAWGMRGGGASLPQPWEYDAARDRHWNPEPGHNHWHEGPPPPGRGTVAGVTPAPWEYDPIQGRHWNPNPGHEHWHDGPPPPPDARGVEADVPDFSPIVEPPTSIP